MFQAFRGSGELENCIATHVTSPFKAYTANDVIHSWWVPEISVKRDAIPGFINEAWTKVENQGIYRGQCTELCGAYHGFMPIEVHVVSREEYDAWLDSKRGNF